MRSVRRDVLFGLVLVLLMLAALSAYIFLHEIGHIVAILAMGGRVHRAVLWGPRARVYYSNIYTPLAVGVMTAGGDAFPLIVFIAVLMSYNSAKRYKSPYLTAGYHLTFVILTVFFIFPLFGWVFLFLEQYNDPIRFIAATGIQPLIVAFSSLGIILLVFWSLYLRRLPHAIITIFTPKRASADREVCSSCGAALLTGSRLSADSDTSPRVSQTEPAAKTAAPYAQPPKRRLVLKIITMSLAVILTVYGVIATYQHNYFLFTLRQPRTQSRTIKNIFHEPSSQNFFTSFNPHGHLAVRYVFRAPVTRTYHFDMRATAGDFVMQAVVITSASGMGGFRNELYNHWGTDFVFGRPISMREGQAVTVYLHLFTGAFSLVSHFDVHGYSRQTLYALLPVFDNINNYNADFSLDYSFVLR